MGLAADRLGDRASPSALALASLAVDAWLPFCPSLLARAALTLAYPLVLVAVGFFPPDDLSAIRERLRLRRAR